MPNGNTTHERLTALEVKFTDIKEDLHEIKNNHLAHLDAGLLRVQWLLVLFILVYLFGADAISKLTSILPF